MNASISRDVEMTHFNRVAGAAHHASTAVHQAATAVRHLPERVWVKLQNAREDYRAAHCLPHELLRKPNAARVDDMFRPPSNLK